MRNRMEGFEWRLSAVIGKPTADFRPASATVLHQFPNKIVQFQFGQRAVRTIRSTQFNAFCPHNTLRQTFRGAK